ncbi:MAG: hypothetical protein IJ438_04900, partial [Clostridia bacterium]|nr:hypothetical protein [Clostridia bacterium]
HPNKLEVRFQNDQAVLEAVEAIVRDAVTEKSVLDKPEEMRLTPEQPARTHVSVTRQETVPAAKPAASVVKPAAPMVRTAPAVPSIAREEKKSHIPVTRPPQPLLSIKDVLKPIASSQPLPEMKQPLRDAAPALQAYVNTVKQQSVPTDYQVAKAAAQKPGTQEQSSFLPEAPKPMKLIGTAFSAYILVEYEEHLLLIDQHAVHERLLFDRMMKALDQHQCGQEMLIPLIVPVTRREQQLLEEHHDMLSAIGLTVEAFGETEVSVRTIPMILGQPQAGDLLRDVIDQLESERGVISLEKRRTGILALACKKAVRGGERLNEGDIRELVSRMVDQKITPTSPRGTPLIVALSHTELDRRFRRMQ